MYGAHPRKSLLPRRSSSLEQEVGPILYRLHARDVRAYHDLCGATSFDRNEMHAGLDEVLRGLADGRCFCPDAWDEAGGSHSLSREKRAPRSHECPAEEVARVFVRACWREHRLSASRRGHEPLDLDSIQLAAVDGDPAGELKRRVQVRALEHLLAWAGCSKAQTDAFSEVKSRTGHEVGNAATDAQRTAAHTAVGKMMELLELLNIRRYEDLEAAIEDGLFC